MIPEEVMLFPKKKRVQDAKIVPVKTETKLKLSPEFWSMK
jgi:hypothetical protein